MLRMKKLKTAKQKIINQQLEIRKKIDSIEFEAHWFRRVFHTFATSFLIILNSMSFIVVLNLLYSSVIAKPPITKPAISTEIIILSIR